MVPLRRLRGFISRRPDDVARFGMTSIVSGIRGAAYAGLQLGRVAGYVSGLGSLGLALHSGWRLVRPGSKQRLSSLRDLGTGMSGLARIGYLAAPISIKIALGGSALQSAVGAYSVVKGLRLRDRSKLSIGAMDLGAGVLFGLSALSICNPYTLLGAVALTSVRMVVSNREVIRTTLGKLGKRLQQLKSRRQRRSSPRVSRPPKPGAASVDSASPSSA